MAIPYRPLNMKSFLGGLPQEGLDQNALAQAMANGNNPIPGLPQPAINQAPGNSIGVPNGKPVMQPDPGNPPGSDSKSARVTFGFGDDLTTPELQAIQKALVDSLQNKHDVSERFQDSRKKQFDQTSKQPKLPNLGNNQQSSYAAPAPVRQSSPNDPWTGPSSR